MAAFGSVLFSSTIRKNALAEMTERKANANGPLKPNPGLNGPPARPGDIGQDDGRGNKQQISPLRMRITPHASVEMTGLTESVRNSG
jgi:hypothetical protein